MGNMIFATTYDDADEGFLADLLDLLCCNKVIMSLINAEGRSFVSCRLLKDALGYSILVEGRLVAVWIRYLAIDDDKLDRLV